MAVLAGRRHGVVTRDLVGHRAVDPLAYETAAILACRPQAVLSHQTAARLWKLPVPGTPSIHSTPKRFIDDRRRMAYLAAYRYQVFPLVWDDLHGGVTQAMKRLRETREERRRLLGL